MPYDWENTPIIIVKREEWGARPPKVTRPIKHPVAKAVLSYDLHIDICKTRDECVKAMQELQTRDMNSHSDDIKYNFLIGGDGRIYEGRGWHTKPCYTLKYSAYYNKRLDVGFIGNYQGNEMVPPQLICLSFDLLKMGREDGYLFEEHKLYEIIGPPTYGNPCHFTYV